MSQDKDSRILYLRYSIFTFHTVHKYFACGNGPTEVKWSINKPYDSKFVVVLYHKQTNLH